MTQCNLEGEWWQPQCELTGRKYDMVFFPPDFELLTALKKFRLDRVNTVSNVKSTVPGLNTLAFRNGEKKVFAGFCQKK